MKIGPIDTKPQATTPVASERKTAGADSTAEASAQVELSSAAAAALDKANDDGSFDAEKVQRIAQAIREGRFRIDADAIADKLISNAQELLGKMPPG